MNLNTPKRASRAVHLFYCIKFDCAFRFARPCDGLNRWINWFKLDLLLWLGYYFHDHDLFSSAIVSIKIKIRNERKWMDEKISKYVLRNDQMKTIYIFKYRERRVLTQFLTSFSVDGVSMQDILHFIFRFCQKYLGCFGFRVEIGEWIGYKFGIGYRLTLSNRGLRPEGFP